MAALRNARGETKVALVSDPTEPVRGELRMRLIDFGGKVLREERKAVTMAPLAVTSFAEYRDAELLRGADPKRSAAVFELLVDGEPQSRGVVYFDEPKHLALPAPRLRRHCAAMAKVSCWSCAAMCLRARFGSTLAISMPGYPTTR